MLEVGIAEKQIHYGKLEGPESYTYLDDDVNSRV